MSILWSAISICLLSSLTHTTSFISLVIKKIIGRFPTYLTKFWEGNKPSIFNLPFTKYPKHVSMLTPLGTNDYVVILLELHM